jgi:transposase
MVDYDNVIPRKGKRMKKTRNIFNSNFKSKIAIEALREAKTTNEIASANGVHPGQVTQWKKTVVENSSSLFERKNAKHTDTSAEVEELQRLVGEQAIQLAWYKKKFGIAN